MLKETGLGDGHWIRKRRGTWIIAVPPEVRRLLGITHRQKLWWSARRSGEAVLALSAKPKEGRLPVRQMARELVEARAEIASIRKRDELRDRSLYAEGFAHGYLQARARLDMPGGASAKRGHRREMWRWAFPETASVEDPKQVAPRPAPSAPRMNARTRRAKRDAEAWHRIETARGPDSLPLPSAPPPGAQVHEEGGSAPARQSLSLPSPPSESEGEAVTPGPSVPGHP